MQLYGYDVPGIDADPDTLSGASLIDTANPSGFAENGLSRIREAVAFEDCPAIDEAVFFAVDVLPTRSNAQNLVLNATGQVPISLSAPLTLFTYTVEDGNALAINGFMFSMSDLALADNYVFSLFANGNNIFGRGAQTAGLPTPPGVFIPYGLEKASQQMFPSGTKHQLIVRPLAALVSNVKLSFSLYGSLYALSGN